VTIKGSKDDVAYAAGTPVVEFAHPQSGLVYRAPQVDATRPGIGYQIVSELNTIMGTAGTPTTLSERFGYYNAKPLPNWLAAKANVATAQAAAKANTDKDKAADLQAKYVDALNIFTRVDYLLAYRVDLLNDLRLFRTAFGY